MKLAILDAHASNPGDLSWKPFEEFADVTRIKGVLGRSRIIIFLLQNNSYFFFFEKARRKSKQKEETFIVFYALTSVDKMDVAGEPALSRSLKNARGANGVHFEF